LKKIIKFIYKKLPFKKQIYSLIKILWTPPEPVYRHLHFEDVFEVSVFGKTTFKMIHYGSQFRIENEIFWAGLTNAWEKESFKLWIELCKNSEVILDVGANTGIYSLIAKAINPRANVYAFEPVDRVYQKLCENVQINQYDIILSNKAVSNFSGEAVIYDRPVEHTTSVTVNMKRRESETIVTPIETITLDDFIEQKEFKNLDLLKIDVETHEPEVMEGFRKYLVHFQPTILIEILDDSIGRKVEEYVKDLNYLYFNIDEKGGIRQSEKIVMSDYYNYLLCKIEIAEKLRLIH